MFTPDPFIQTLRDFISNKKIGLVGCNCAEARFAEDFVAHAWLNHSVHGDGVAMIKMLNDQKYLCDPKMFESYFHSTMSNMVHSDLAANKTFAAIIRVLIGNKSKGVGIGELLLPLIVNGWTRGKNEGDGFVSGGKREVKNADGASIKPIESGITNKGLVDTLNKKYMFGLVPGKKKHAQLISKLGKNVTEVFTNYFKELWPTFDTTDMIKEMSKNWSDADFFDTTVGQHMLAQYQKIDIWKSIVVVSGKRDLEIVNIPNPLNAEILEHISFSTRFSRMKDTQAVPDGYTVLKLIKNKKPKEKKKSLKAA
jgi:hypothetical protein